MVCRFFPGFGGLATGRDMQPVLNRNLDSVAGIAGLLGHHDLEKKGVQRSEKLLAAKNQQP